jgi:hypothetical protein
MTKQMEIMDGAIGYVLSYQGKPTKEALLDLANIKGLHEGHNALVYVTSSTDTPTIHCKNSNLKQIVTDLQRKGWGFTVHPNSKLNR